MPRKLRGVLSVLLIVLACLFVPLGALSTWAKHDIEDTDRYVATMAPLADDSAVREAVADAVTDSAMKDIDVGPLQAVVRGFVRDAVVSFTETEAFQTAWNAANRAAHEAVIDALDNDSDSAVTIDLAPITQQVRQQLADEGVPYAGQIPVRHTEVTVMQSNDLAKLRKGFHVLQATGLWLPLAALLLAVGGILLAVRRRRAVIGTGIGAALGGAALAVAVAVGRGRTLDDLPPDVSRPAVAAVYDALTSPLRTAAWVILGIGLAVALGVWLTGRLRRRRGPQPQPGPSRTRVPAEPRA